MLNCLSFHSTSSTSHYTANRSFHLLREKCIPTLQTNDAVRRGDIFVAAKNHDDTIKWNEIEAEEMII